MTPQEIMARTLCKHECPEADPDAKAGDARIAFWEEWLPDASAVTAALESAGYRIVPVDLTAEMEQAGDGELDRVCRPHKDGIVYPKAISVWRRILAAYRPEGSGS